MKRLFISLSMALLLAAMGASGALGADGIIIPIDSLVRAEPGSLTVLAEVDTPPELVGASCVGIAAAKNGESVHPNNDIIIETGGTVAVLKDVESASEKETVASGEVVLGETIKLTLSMGPHGWFSGGVVVVVDTNCTPPTTVPPTTVPPTTVPPTTVPPTTVPPTTVPPTDGPAIDIVKTATPTDYGSDGIGHFTIDVTNPGPLALTDVVVTDDVAIAMDPDSDCPATIGDLAVNQTVTYTCTVGNLDYAGLAPFTNEATATGKGPNGQQVVATDNATVFPPVLGSTITTQPPATTEAPGETLPVTGIDGNQMRGIGMAALIMLLSGIVLLGGAAVIGQQSQDR